MTPTESKRSWLAIAAMASAKPSVPQKGATKTFEKQMDCGSGGVIGEGCHLAEFVAVKFDDIYQ